MRLAIVRQRYNPFGGAERFVDSALAALLEHNVEVSLYTREWHPTKQTLLQPIICNPFHIGSAARDRSFARAVCRALAIHKPDLVQSHERIACCDIFRAGDGVHRVWLDERARHMSWSGKLGLRLNPYHRQVLAAEEKLFTSPRLKAVICNSNMVREELRATYGVSEDKLHVIYNAVDSTQFHPNLQVHRQATRDALRIPRDAIVLLFLGSGFLRKGLAFAIEAIAPLPPHFHLLVVGHDKHRSRYATLAAERGIAGRVHLAGPQRATEAFYGSADAFVLPTLYDPFPNAALEAMACGLPVITSTKCGAAEMVTAHEAGFVCRADDTGALSEAMSRLADGGLRAAQGAAARNAVRGLTPDAMSRQLLLLYHRLLGTGVGSGAQGPHAPPAAGSPGGSTEAAAL
jgi:UDP-glucose:(heptosyl)LPS alpha-1,3-glucosyltransferase